MKKIIILGLFSSSIAASQTCMQDFYKLTRNNEVLSVSSLEKLYNNCPSSQKEGFKYDLLRSGRRVNSDQKLTALKDFISSSFSQSDYKTFEVYSAHENSYDLQYNLSDIENIVEYAPDVFDHLYYDFSESDLVEIAKKVSNHPNFENKHYILSHLLALSLDKPIEFQDKLLGYGASFLNTPTGIENLCLAVEETIQSRVEYLSDDYHDEGYDSLMAEVNEETDNYFNSISKYVSLDGVYCGGETLRSMYNDIKDPEFWGLEYMYSQDDYEEDEVIETLSTSDDDFFFLKTKVSFNDDSFAARIKITKSCASS
uniref:hypothetical protein n=1 Tax=Halobacteriovorax sp. TaxID=2020862 RepID=UPI0035677711